jgi:hypothetical protein
MDVNREHVISIELSAEEWQAFVELEPQPVTWLRERIQESIARAREGQSVDDAEPATA